MKENTEAVKKIALFRALFLGDMLCIIPVVRALRAHYPEATIFMIGLPWQEQLVTRYQQYFDHFIPFPGWPGLPERDFDPLEVVKFLSDMQSHRFDIVLQMQGNGAVTNAMCMLWNSRITCGLRQQGDYCPDEKLFPVSADDDHEVKRFIKLLEALDVPAKGTHLEFPISEDEENTFQQRNSVIKLPLHQYVCLHPGSRDPKRRWSATNFAWIGDQLVNQGYTVVVTGSNQESSLIDEVVKKMKNPAVNSVAEFNDITLGTLGLLIKNSKLLVSNDTGVSHMAVALAIPSVVIFSRYSTVSRWAPENAALHKIIRHDESNDLSHVWHCVQGQLALGVDAHVAFQ